jgi:two-component system, NtrC family, nitrogen regulation sensor histidine kinase NtrY
MVSEKLLQTRSSFGLLVLMIFFFLLAGALFMRSLFVPAIVCCMAGLIATGFIVRVYNFTNQSVAYFFNALRNDDSNLLFPDRIKNKNLAGLFESMNRLNLRYQEIRLQNEYNEKYYRALIQHSSAGLLVMNENLKIELINEAACRYAGISPESTNSGLLKIKNPLFYEAVCNLKAGENITYKSANGASFQLLVFRASLLKKSNTIVKLISIQDIRQELESKELESYRKLISVMTHEIMNLLSPITSVSNTLYDMYFPGSRSISLEEFDAGKLRTTLNGLRVVSEQSAGMVNFMNNYRKISKIPKPVISPFEVSEWVEQIRIVFAGKMEENHIEFHIECDRTATQILADKQLINQVLVNLVNNAFEAVMETNHDRKIRIDIMNSNVNRSCIRITNNGPAIPSDLQDKIFVPFFTTKKEGSGIGLSISQEIMTLHKGSLTLVSSPGHTAFIMEI